MNPRLVTLPDPVPILDEHLLKDENGRDITYLDRAKLQRIADNNNRRVSKSGDEAPLVIGHTEDGQPETDSPPIVGYARDFFVSRGKRSGHRIVPTKGPGKHYLFARWSVYEDKVDCLRKYPRRSVELWTSRWEVDPISLLGATTPDRDLGLVRMSDKGPSVRVMTPNEEDTRMPFQDIEGQEGPEEESNQPLTLAQLQQTEEFQFLHELMKQVSQGEGPEQEGMPQEEGQGEQPIEEEMPGEGEEEMSPEGGEEEMEEPVRRAASYGGSGNSTFVPSNGGRRQMARTNMSPTNERSLRVRLARQEAAREADREELNTLRLQLSRSKRELDLANLEAQGIEMDVSEELDTVQNMDEARYNSHLEKIVKRYRRSPVSSRPVELSVIGRVPTSGRGGKAQVNRQEAVQRVIKKARNAEEYDKLLAQELGE